MDINLKKTAIFWDYENVPFSSGDLTNFLNDIEEIKKSIKEGSNLKCFGDWKKIPETTQTEIRQGGFELIQVPQTRKNAVDQAITISAINNYHQSEYNDFFLISADGDFTALLMDLKNKGVNLYIIARKKNLAKDLRTYCNELFYLTSKGNVFKNVVKNREDIFNLIERSFKDAENAFELLKLKSPNKEIEIYSFVDWEKYFLTLENYEISPLILRQLINLEEYFEIYVKLFGYGHTIDFQYLCIHKSEKKKNIRELELRIQIPNAKTIKIPIRDILKLDLKELLIEFTSNEIFEDVEPNDELEIKQASTQSSITTQKMEPTISTNKTIDLNVYLNEIAKVFREMIKNEKSPGQIKLPNLNSKVCQSLNINTSKKIYKELGFKSFTDAVKAAKGMLSKKITIKKDAINY